MAAFDVLTKHGHRFDECASAMQKAVRRGDARIAGYFALELFHSGYWLYVWKRLYTISAEDVDGLVTKEIHALFNGFLLINDKNERNDRGRIFISKAVLVLCKSMKSRDADHLQNLVYDEKRITDEELNDILNNTERIDVPSYAFDVHTKRGRLMGKNKFDFLIDEFIALNPRQPGLFDDLIKTENES